MPRYEVRLDAQDHFREDGSPQFRVTRLDAPSEQEARWWCERQELRRTLYEMPADELAQIEADEANPDTPTLSGAAKGRLATHRQSKPYLVTSVVEIPTRREG